jgi:hypothetical protein
MGQGRVVSHAFTSDTKVDLLPGGTPGRLIPLDKKMQSKSLDPKEEICEAYYSVLNLDDHDEVRTHEPMKF